MLRLSQSPCARTLVSLSVNLHISPFGHKVLDRMEIFPVLRYVPPPIVGRKRNRISLLPRRKLQLYGTNIKLQTLKILSPKFPQLQGLDVSNCDWVGINYHQVEDFAKFLCERDDEGNQLFPNLDSLWQIHGSLKGEDLSYLVRHRDGIENFRVLNMAPPFYIGDPKELSDLHSALLEK